MTPFDRQIRAQIYRLFVGRASHVDADVIANSRGWDVSEVEASLRRLVDEHRIALAPGSSRVVMAHPFSGIDTGYTSSIGNRSWRANCAWDALAILALLGDGVAEAMGPAGEMVWTVKDGVVSPVHLVHLLVPARNFWDDVGFT